MHGESQFKGDFILKKKKKQKVTKRRSRAHHKKKRTQSSSKIYGNQQLIDIPALSEIEAPEGFRAVSLSHAMMEYAKPVMDFVEKGIVEDINDAFQIAMRIWNYSIEVERTGLELMRNEIVSEISKTFKLTKQESLEFLDTMIKRKHDLLPFDIQPDYPRTMFIKKEEHFLIPEFNYDALAISETIIPADDEDKKLINMIHQLDKYIIDDTDYPEWESYYLQFEELCKKRFEKWMLKKGIQKYQDEFPFYVDIFLSFTYRYSHNNQLTLKSIFPIYFEEFFIDHILRKVFIEPHEFVNIPPAIKTFYMFLFEKGYLENHNIYIEIINGIEPHFINTLRKRFS